MDPVTQLGFQFAKEVSTQLITLSTGLLALTIAFGKDLVRGPPRARGWLGWAWFAHLLSIGAGVFALLALTGTLMPVDPATRNLQFGFNVRLFAGSQVVAFAVGTLFLVVYGWKSWSRAAVEQAAQFDVIMVPADQLKLVMNEQVAAGFDVTHIIPVADERVVAVLKKK